MILAGMAGAGAAKRVRHLPRPSAAGVPMAARCFSRWVASSASQTSWSMSDGAIQRCELSQ
jgi:hypothetical protein